MGILRALDVTRPPRAQQPALCRAQLAGEREVVLEGRDGKAVPVFPPPGTATPTSEHVKPRRPPLLAGAVFALSHGLGLPREGSRYF